MAHFVPELDLPSLNIDHNNIKCVNEYGLETQHNYRLVFLRLKVKLNICIHDIKLRLFDDQKLWNRPIIDIFIYLNEV